jgi:hypothetical protein
VWDSINVLLCASLVEQLRVYGQGVDGVVINVFVSGEFYIKENFWRLLNYVQTLLSLSKLAALACEDKPDDVHTNIDGSKYVFSVLRVVFVTSWSVHHCKLLLHLLTQFSHVIVRLIAPSSSVLANAWVHVSDSNQGNSAPEVCHAPMVNCVGCTTSCRRIKWPL